MRSRKYCDGHVPWGQHLKGVPSRKKGLTIPREQREQIAAKLRGRKLSEEHRRKIRAALLTPEVQKKLRVPKPTLKGNHHNMQAILDGRVKISSYPTSIERKMTTLLEKVYPKQWKYIGHGGVIIGGKIPDFINCNGLKAVIEVSGRYWHKPEYEQMRSEHFAQYGFHTLIVWEEEFQHERRLRKRIQGFVDSLESADTGGRA